uniref:ATP synthase F0 subunit 8 n=1 Tax=Franciscoloa pallida TaxID=2965262 RepID=UPI00257F155B|nr:ATP synthase F0 subunit 8 [Franciscoloa pallida]WGU50379.1 ATP synthase subunit 8 [Franciscoloa pallida]
MPQMFPSSIMLIFTFVIIVFFIFMMSSYWQVSLDAKEVENSHYLIQKKESFTTPW